MRLLLAAIACLAILSPTCCCLFHGNSQAEASCCGGMMTQEQLPASDGCFHCHSEWIADLKAAGELKWVASSQTPSVPVVDGMEMISPVAARPGRVMGSDDSPVVDATRLHLRLCRIVC